VRLLKFSVKNYKSFGDSNETGTLSSGVNVIIGQNNSGKTALLEALTFRLKPIPHRNVRTHPTPDAKVDVVPQVTVDAELSRLELLEWIADRGGVVSVRYATGDAAELFARLQNKQSFTLSATFRPGQSVSGMIEGLTGTSGSSIHFTVRRPTLEPHQEQQTGDELGSVAGQMIPVRTYLFGAERFNLGEYGFGHSGALMSNATNLPMVLNVLQANHARFQRFNDLVRRVLPQVSYICVSPVEGSQLRILVGHLSPQFERLDLAVPLSDSGTGVGQILAVLYVLITSEQPQVIVIDEPQSFLHRSLSPPTPRLP
jgi:hypothetical protein